MSTLKDLKNDRNKLVTDAQQLLLNFHGDAEKRTSAHKMLADADVLDTSITALEKIETREAEERSRTTPGRPTPGELNGASYGNESLTKEQKEKRAFGNYIRYGIIDNTILQRDFFSDSANKEFRDITSNGASSTLSGAQFVPQAFYPILTEAQKSWGQVLNVIKMINVADGAPTKYATISDTANLLAVLGESSTASETDPTSISGSTISTDFLTTGVIRISLAELGDSAFDLDTWVRQAFGKRYYRGLASMVTNGNSSNVASLKTSAHTGATTASATAISWSDLASTYAALDPAYEQDAAWSINSTTRGALLGVVDALGRPLYIPAVTAETFDMILGKKVILSQYMDNIGSTNVPVLYGDHSAYLLRVVTPGLSIMRMNERYLDSGEIGFVGYARAGGALLAAASSYPIIALACHS
jgi:HK97 family phage major capsid protein